VEAARARRRPGLQRIAALQRECSRKLAEAAARAAVADTSAAQEMARLRGAITEGGGRFAQLMRTVDQADEDLTSGSCGLGEATACELQARWGEAERSLALQEENLKDTLQLLRTAVTLLAGSENAGPEAAEPSASFGGVPVQAWGVDDAPRLQAGTWAGPEAGAADRACELSQQQFGELGWKAGSHACGGTGAGSDDVSRSKDGSAAAADSPEAGLARLQQEMQFMAEGAVVAADAPEAEEQQAASEAAAAAAEPDQAAPQPDSLMWASVRSAVASAQAGAAGARREYEGMHAQLHDIITGLRPWAAQLRAPPGRLPKAEEPCSAAAVQAEADAVMAGLESEYGMRERDRHEQMAHLERAAAEAVHAALACAGEGSAPGPCCPGDEAERQLRAALAACHAAQRGWAMKAFTYAAYLAPLERNLRGILQRQARPAMLPQRLQDFRVFAPVPAQLPQAGSHAPLDDLPNACTAVSGGHVHACPRAQHGRARPGGRRSGSGHAGGCRKP
jgi:hypothetical protein